METKTETMGIPERLTHYAQVRTLVLDMAEPIWTRAQLTLYILTALDTDDQDWLVMLNRANLAHLRGDMEEYRMVLDLMKKDVGYKE